VAVDLYHLVVGAQALRLEAAENNYRKGEATKVSYGAWLAIEKTAKPPPFPLIALRANSIRVPYDHPSLSSLVHPSFLSLRKLPIPVSGRRDSREY
jgi:hypothetical protein